MIILQENHSNCSKSCKTHDRILENTIRKIKLRSSKTESPTERAACVVQTGKSAGLGEFGARLWHNDDHRRRATAIACTVDGGTALPEGVVQRER